MAWFLDSSAVVKRYITETGTGWIRTLTDPAASIDLYLATITEVEVVSAFVRRHRSGGITMAVMTAVVSQFQHDFANQYQTVEMNEDVLNRAVDLVQTHGLRAYDGVQLAASVELEIQRSSLGLSPLTLVSADLDLNTAAGAEGLAVEDPNAHP